MSEHSNPPKFGVRSYVILTLIYVAVMVVGPFIFNIAPNTLNEWGDYFTGILSPIALAWFIGTLLLQKEELALQRKELKLNRKEMVESRKVMREQAAHQERAAEANLEANKIAAANAFADRVPQYEEHFGNVIRRMTEKLPNEITTSKGRLVGRPPATPYDLSKRFSTLVGNDMELKAFLNKYEITSDIFDYVALYSEFKKKAEKTDNTVFVRGPYFDLYNLMLKIIKNYNLEIEK